MLQESASVGKNDRSTGPKPPAVVESAVTHALGDVARGIVAAFACSSLVEKGELHVGDRTRTASQSIVWSSVSGEN